MVELRRRTRHRETSPSPSTATNTNTPTRHKRAKVQKEEDDDNDVEEINELTTVEKYSQDRPFEIISNFPASLDVPNYNSILTHPLTIKDSGVLYNSLYQSRRTWIYNFGNLFPLYWKKEFLESDVVEEDVSNFSIKDKMQKMADCTMIGGPHTFQIRLFILKDESIETRWQEEQDSKKKEKELKKLNELDAKMKKSQEKIKRRMARELEKKAKREAKLKAKEEKAILLQKKKEEAKFLKKKIKSEKQQLNQSKVKKYKTLSKDSTTTTTVDKDKDKNKISTQSSNDSKMIANLNIMAKNNIELAQLMNKVANGQADLKEVSEFRNIIKMAKQMPPPPGWVDPNEISSKKESAHLEKASKNSTKSVQAGETNEDSQREKGEKVDTKKDDSTITISSQPDRAGDDDSKDAISSQPDRAGDDGLKDATSSQPDNVENDDSKDTTSQSDDAEKDDSNNVASSQPDRAGTDDSNDTTPKVDESEQKDPSSTPQVKPKRGGRRKNSVEVKKESSTNSDGIVVKKRPGRKPKIKDPLEVEEEKLTAFQLKYLTGATLMLEFLEEKYIRYYIPKDSIIEYIEEKDEFLVSFITVHNQRDMNRFAKRSKKPLDNEIYFLKDCPSPLFSAITITIKDIPKRFHPIVLNSPNKLEDVQRVMTQILEIGTRLTGYNLWYQLDGYDDANLAEYYRVEANTYENGLKGRRARRSSSVNA
ncbi:SWR1-complex protein 3 [Monosporozyma servazzii]